MHTRNTAIATLVFVTIYNIVFFHTNVGIGTGFLFLALNSYFFFTRNRDGKNIQLANYSAVVGVIFAFLFSLRDNGIVQLVNFAAATFFSFVALYLYKYIGNIPFTIPSFIAMPLLVLKSAVKSFFSLLKQDTWTSKNLEKDTTSSFVRGLIIAVPLVGVLLFLLTQADPIFNKLTQNVLANMGERVFVSLLIFIGLMSFGLARILETIFEEKEAAHVPLGKAHELAVITGSVISLFAVFIAVQFRYLFFSVGEKELSQLGIASLTYSEYVRKGFFELLIASVIASGVIIYVLKYLHQLKDRQKQLVQIFSGVMTIETGLLLLSAVKRVFLYADAHGLTRARVFGFVFLVWLAVLLVIFLVRIFREMKKEQFVGSVLITTLFVTLLINVINVDGMIATKYKPTVNNEVDYYYLVYLSADASDSWIPAIENADKILSQLNGIAKFSPDDNRKLYWVRSTLEELMIQSDYLTKKYGDVKVQWQSYNMSEYSAYKTIRENSNTFSKIKSLLSKVNTLQNRASIEVQQNTPIDRSTKPPLVH